MKKVKLFILRHAERLDHVDLEWQNYAHRAHDAPLSDVGISQVKALSKEFFLKRNLDGKDIKNVFLVSPLNRCALTARTIIEELNLIDKTSIKYEQGLGEANVHLRKRMMGTHKNSNPDNALTGEARHCQEPVLLAPGDLMAVSYPAKVDLAHKTLHQVKYTSDCYEILDNDSPSEILPYEDRVQALLPKFKSWLVEEQKMTKESTLNVFVITHGSISRTMTKYLTKAEEEIKFGNATTVEIDADLENDAFKFKAIWRIPNDPKAKATKKAKLPV